MKALRGFAIFMLMAGLALVLVAFSVVAVTCLTLGNPSFVADRIQTSGFYDDFADNTLEVLSIDIEGTPREVDEAIERMRPVFEQTLTPELLRSKTEAMLEGVDEWLDGDTGLPEFRVDTAAIRADLDSALADSLTDRMVTLPVCPLGTDYESWDPFTTDCRPPGWGDSDLLTTQIDEFTSRMPLLGREDLAGTDLVNDNNEGQWRMVPRAYRWGKVSLGLFAGLLLVACALGVLLSPRRASIMWRLGHVALFNALVLFVGAALSALFLGEHGLDEVGRSGTPEQVLFVEKVLVPLVRTFAQGVGAWLAVFGAVFVALCALCYLIAFWLRSRQNLGVTTQASTTDGSPS